MIKTILLVFKLIKSEVHHSSGSRIIQNLCTLNCFNKNSEHSNVLFITKLRIFSLSLKNFLVLSGVSIKNFLVMSGVNFKLSFKYTYHLLFFLPYTTHSIISVVNWKNFQ